MSGGCERCYTNCPAPIREMSSVEFREATNTDLPDGLADTYETLPENTRVIAPTVFSRGYPYHQTTNEAMMGERAVGVGHSAEVLKERVMGEDGHGRRPQWEYGELCHFISAELQELMAVQTRMSEERLHRLEERFKSLEVQIVRQFKISHSPAMPATANLAKPAVSSNSQIDGQGQCSSDDETMSPKFAGLLADHPKFGKQNSLIAQTEERTISEDLGTSKDDTSFKLKDVWTEKIRIANIVDASGPYHSEASGATMKELTDETRILRQRTEMSFENNKEEAVVEEKKEEQRTLSEGVFRHAIIHPSSSYRLFWDLNGMALIAYDVVTIPLFMAFPFGKSLFQDVMFWWTLLFWTADFVFAFFTGYYRGETLEMRPVPIAKNYLRTWFLLDIMVIGVDWFIIIAGGDSGGGGARLARASKSVRALRVLRSLRLLRLAKLRRIMNDIKDRILVNSQFLVIFLDILKLIIIIVCVCHLIACIWYSVGSSGQETGWVNSVIKDGPGDRFIDRDISFRYISCLHWALAQFTPAPNNLHPGTTGERTFATIVLLFGMIVFSSFVSSITATMTRLRQLSSNNDAQMSLLRRYLRQHRVNTQLGIRIQKYCEFVLQDQQKRIQEQDVKVLQLLSEPLQQRLAYELYEPILHGHPFFAKYSTLNESAFLAMCKQCLSNVYYSNGDSVFAAGTAAKSMLIVTKGKLTYSWNPHGLASKKKQNNSSGSGDSPLNNRINRSESGIKACLKDESVCLGQGICEAVLWMPWDHVGTLIAVTVCELVSISSDKFAALTKQYATAYMWSQRYARSFVEECQSLHSVTDLVGSDEFIEKVVFRADGQDSLSPREAQVPLHAVEAI